MVYLPDIYLNKALRAFLECYRDDPNVLAATPEGTYVRVILRDLDEGFFPTIIDGVPFRYEEAPGMKEVS